MKIDKTVYRYIEFELYHYEQYKKEIQLERERILDASPCPPDGQPKGNQVSNPTQDKGIRLIEGPTSVAVLKMERVIEAVEGSLKRLSPDHSKIFRMIYINGRKDRYGMCDDIHVSYETFNRYKNDIVKNVGKDLGVI